MTLSKTEHAFEGLLEFLKRNRGFDFTGYKRPSLERRIEKRMVAAGVKGYAEYQDYLEVHQEEFAQLFNTILINVTAFFRDEGAWEFLSQHVIPNLLGQREAGAPLRVWSAGCASGEEAYTLAMVLAEILGVETFRERVKIYATDVDEEALTKARHGIYSEQEVAEVPDKLRKKYFDQIEGQFAFRKDLRRQVIFGRHDLINDAPISRVDLLVCRNTLMYLNAETQAKILARFHFALTDGGILFLGRAETLLTHGNTFEPVDLRRRISTKAPRGNLNLRDRLMLMPQNGNEENDEVTQHFRLRDLAGDAAPVAQLVVGGSGMLAHANARARAVFGVKGADIGRTLSDLKVSYRPVELRSLIEQANNEHRTVIVRDVEWQPVAGDTRYFDVHIVPLTDAGAHLGSTITFTDVSSAKRLQLDLEHARQELETAYEELQSTNEELETMNEELQSTVEELETTNEELETTNEELQSTNEELETMNEELQSTNEELTTMNDEMRERSDELTNVNLFLESVLASVRGGVIVVDRELVVLAWNQKAQDLWGLREEEAVGKHLLGLDIGLPLDDLKAPIRKVLAGDDGKLESFELDATNRRGKAIRCRLTLSRLKQQNGNEGGVILTTEQLGE